MAAGRSEGTSQDQPTQRNKPQATKLRPVNLDWESLDRQDWHLWVLAALLLLVLSMSLLSFMFPTAFWFGDSSALNTSRRAFFGFCTLQGLVLVYLMQRQRTIRRLKRELYEAKSSAAAAEETAKLQGWASLPGVNQFRDSLAMEYRRASHSGEELALMFLAVSNVSPMQIGEVTHLLHSLLRRGETLFRVADDCLALLLPGMQSSDAAAFATQIRDRISLHFQEAKLEPSVISYPSEVSSLAEFESRLRAVAR